MREGNIRALFNRAVQRIDTDTITVWNKEKGETEPHPAQTVYLLTGYLPDRAFLEKIGLTVDPDELTVAFDEETYETDIPGLFLCGTVAAGIRTEKVFIENGRDHAKRIAERIAGT